MNKEKSQVPKSKSQVPIFLKMGVIMPTTNYKLKPGGRICRCPTCGEAFSGIKAFDIHRVGVHGENRSCIRLGGSNRHIITTPKGKH
jgi:hypothetical protein